ncbi:MAG: hypothetical protein Q9219_001060 [cf. Caloplaca sp. 3 TL-2023]
MTLNSSPMKRVRYEDDDQTRNEFSSSQGQVDPTYGQRGAFPGLDDTTTGEEDALFYGPASDGMEYLRMVRLEAKGVPNLLTAPKPVPEEEEGKEEREENRDHLYEDDPRGYYADGAYVAVPSSSSSSFPHHRQPNNTDSGPNAETTTDPQEAYYLSLLSNFRALTTLLRSSSSPSPPKTQNLPPKNWRTTFLSTPPTPSLLHSLPQETTIAALTALSKHLNFHMLEQGAYVGAWAWGLLARCREVGMMGSEEVGVVRGLGKKASGMVREIGAGFGGGGGDRSQSEEDEDEGESEAERVPSSTTARNHEETRHNSSSPSSPPPPHHPLPSSPSSLQHTPSPSPSSPKIQIQIQTQTRTAATLDMILTIAGEEYGQRDLLAGRTVWD